MLHKIILVSVLIGLTACASQDKYLKAEIGMHVSRSVAAIPVDEDLTDLVAISLVNPNGTLVTDGKADEQGIYYSVDITELLGRPRLGLPAGASDSELADRRNRVIRILMTVSDFNSETYLSRTFASNLYIRGFRGVLDRSFTALQTGTSLVSPQITAGLGLTNLLIGGIGDEYTKLIFAEKTFEALQNAIEAERAARKAPIYQSMGKSYAEYPIQNALADLRRLAEASSIRIGLNKLVDVSQTDKDVKEATMNSLLGR